MATGRVATPLEQKEAWANEPSHPAVIATSAVRSLRAPRQRSVPHLPQAATGLLTPPPQPRLVPRLAPALAPAARPRLRRMESPQREFERTWQPRLWLRLAGLILIAAWVIAFIVGNSDETSVNFVVGEATTSLIWVILLSVLAGLLAGVLISQLHGRRRRDARSAASPKSEARAEMPSSISDGDA